MGICIGCLVIGRDRHANTKKRGSSYILNFLLFYYFVFLDFMNNKMDCFDDFLWLRDEEIEVDYRSSFLLLANFVIIVLVFLIFLGSLFLDLDYIKIYMNLYREYNL